MKLYPEPDESNPHPSQYCCSVQFHVIPIYTLVFEVVPLLQIIPRNPLCIDSQSVNQNSFCINHHISYLALSTYVAKLSFLFQFVLHGLTFGGQTFYYLFLFPLTSRQSLQSSLTRDVVIFLPFYPYFILICLFYILLWSVFYFLSHHTIPLSFLVFMFFNFVYIYYFYFFSFFRSFFPRVYLLTL